MKWSSLKGKRLVVKIGSSTLTAESPHLNRERIADFVSQLAGLHERGLQIIVVSSGAIAAGRSRLTLAKESKNIPFKQILAAVGQTQLMQAYEQLFFAKGILVAQTLLTRIDLADRQGYINARNTLIGLLEHRVVPIVNENDVVAVEEIKFGDNDNLSARVASMVDADLLLILTDIEGLYTADPRVDPSAKLIPEVKVIDKKIRAMAGNSQASYGTGGMATKVEAARLATSFGCRVVVAKGAEKEVINRILGGERLGTTFLPKVSHLESRKRWIISRASSTGFLTVDSGAQEALRHRGRSLLPAGVAGVEGHFARGDAVNIFGRGHDKIGCGLVNYSSQDIVQILGRHSSEIEEILGYQFGSEIVHRDSLVVF